MKPNRRTRILVDRDLQLRFALIVLLASTSAVFIQTALTSFMIGRLAEQLPNDGRALMTDVPGALALNAGITLAVTVPWLVFLSLLGTFRVFGPMVGFRNFMRDVAAGRRSSALTIRKGDHLQDVCDLLNEVTEPLRADIAERQGKGDDESSSGAIDRAA
ncbi:hypothetical protein [Engelhardtia mirabilis]